MKLNGNPPFEGEYDDSPYQSDTDHDDNDGGDDNVDDESIDQAINKDVDKEEMLRILDNFEIKAEPGEEIFVPENKTKRNPKYN